MSTRRGFIASLFTAPAAVAAWSTVAKAEAVKELRPNCLLAEQSEVWTLADGFKLPVRRIEVQLDFEPAVTWEFTPPKEWFESRGHKTESGFHHKPTALSFMSRMLTAQRRVFPRFTEKELRADYSLQKEGHGPLDRAGQLVDLSDQMTYDQLQDIDKRRVAIVERDDDTPFETVLRHRMTNCWLGFNGNGRRPLGVYTVLTTPTQVWYVLGVSEFEVTSANMLLQVPAKSLFG